MLTIFISPGVNHMVNVFFISNKGLSLQKLLPNQPCCGDRYYTDLMTFYCLGHTSAFYSTKKPVFQVLFHKKLKSGGQVRPPVCLSSQVSTNMFMQTVSSI